MKNLRILPFLCITGLSLAISVAHAGDEDLFLEKLRASPEQAMGHGRTALWTLSLVATQYQPLRPTPAMQEALRAQNEGRFLEALILLEEAGRSGQSGADAGAESGLLHASFLLQGKQSRQALEILAPLLAQTKYAADAYALTAMAYLQQGQMQKALDAAQHVHDSAYSVLPVLALSYVLQGMGRLAEAREAMHGFNARAPQAVALAREAELALTLDQIQPARTLVAQAEEMNAAHPYVIAVSGLVHLIDGQAGHAKAAFETALRRDPKDGKALLGLGLAEIKLGNFEAGQKKLQAANEAEPGNALILTYLGRSQQQAGQAAAARASWRDAQDADPRDPTPWLYQAQAELQVNRLTEARESLRQAQARAAYRSVYRGANLLREDEQLLAANLAAIQNQSGMESLAFHTLSDGAGEKNATTLRNQADVLQGLRFAESARRSLLLQSQFNEHPGNLPAEQDIYGDGAGQTGASNPQHGVVSMLGAQQASYHNYDELFSPHVALAADGIIGNQKSNGVQIRVSAGNDTLGIGIAQRQYKTDGNAPFENLDNRIEQGIVQWRPALSTQAFVSYQTFDSQRGETMYPADIDGMRIGLAIDDNSRITRLGLRHSLTDSSELRILWSEQKTGQSYDFVDIVSGASLGINTGRSSVRSMELQYRASGAGYATQWGAQQTRTQLILAGSDYTKIAQQFYAAWQQVLAQHWQLDAGLGRGKIDNRDNAGTSDTYLERWLPRLGLVYAPDAGTHARLAAWKGMTAFSVGDAALAPASLAGIVLDRPDDSASSGKLVHAVALGADKRLNPEWLLEGQAQRRRTDALASNSAAEQILLRHQVDESRLALHWQPGSQPWSASLAWEYERFQSPPFPAYYVLNSIQEQRLHAQQLELRWFAAAQWTANLALSHNRVDGTLQTNPGPPTLLPYQDSFNQADASLNWRFNRYGSLTAGMRNAGDTQFQYTNIDPLIPRFSNGRLVYARLKLTW